MRRIIAFILVMTLSGCTLVLQNLNLHSYSILSDISPSSLPCVDMKDSDYTSSEDPNDILSEVSAAFLSSDFVKLQQYYDVYSKRTSRVATGRWGLEYFYGNLIVSDSLKDENYWRESDGKFQEWIKAFPRSPAPYNAYSSFLISRGYHFRGDGYAHEVPRQAWDLFYANIDLAMNTLNSTKEISSVDPHWYVLMMDIARAKGFRKSQVRKLLQEALSKEAYYYNIYHEAFTYLLPKWSGSFVEAEKFATDAARITHECEGKGVYTRLYLRAFRTQPEFTNDPNNLFDERQVNWSKMSKGFIDLMSRYSHEFYLNQYAKYACLAKDKIKTKVLINQIRTAPNKEVWDETYPIVTFSWCQMWASEPQV